MQPKDYMIDAAGTGDVLAGLGAAMTQRGNQQQMRINEATEARAAEMQPLRMEGARLSNEATRQAIEQRRAQMARQEQFQTAMGELAQMGPNATAEDYARVSMQFPQLSRGLMDTFSALDDTRKRGTVQVLAQAATALKNGNADRAIRLAEDYASAAEAAGDPQGAATARSMAQIMKTQPDAALASLGVAIHGLDPDTATFVFGGGERKVSRTVPYRNGTDVTFYSNGDKEVRDAAGRVYTDPAEVQALIDEAVRFGVSEQGDRAFVRGLGANEADIATGAAAEAENARGTVEGTAAGEANVGAADAARKAQAGVDLITSIINDPALGAITGNIEGRLPPGIRGGQAGVDLAAKIEQLQGQVFLQAFESLKGGGAITQIEGVKAEQAMARLNRAQSQEAFKAALVELLEVYDSARQRAEERMSSSSSPAPSPAPTTGTRSYLSIPDN